MKPIVIIGPTAVGKTSLSIALAKHFNGEIINADSTQIYKGLDIATAKVTEEEKENIKHHLIDIKDIKENYTVYDFQKDARKKIADITKKGKTPILVGGTGLYIKAVLYNYQFDSEEEKSDYSSFSNEELYKELLKLDPDTKIHPNNRKRVERAINYCINNKKPFSQKEVTNEIVIDSFVIGLTTSREVLYEKIDKRVDVMLEKGLLLEAKKIFDSNIRTKAVTTPIGYKELFLFFENKETLESCISKIKQNSHHYAKRQYTWFNNQMCVKWFNTNYENFNETINEVINYIEKNM